MSAASPARSASEAGGADARPGSVANGGAPGAVASSGAKAPGPSSTSGAAGASSGDAANVAQSFQFLQPDQLDDLARAFLHLAREVWVLRDRQRIFEAVLAERGIDVAEAIDRHQPSAELQRQLDAERAAFVRTLLGALAPNAKL